MPFTKLLNTGQMNLGSDPEDNPLPEDLNVQNKNSITNPAPRKVFTEAAKNII